MFPTKEDEIAQAVAEGICAKVYNAPIYLSQVDRRVQERLWRTGRKPEAVHASEMQLLRLAAMDEIIDENLMRIKAKVNSKEVTVTDDEINAELTQFEKKFSNSEDLDKALALTVEVEALCEQYWRALQIGKPAILSAKEMRTVLKKFATYGQASNEATSTAAKSKIR